MQGVEPNGLGDLEHGFRGQLVDGEGNVVGRRELLVADHVPERVPEQQTLEAVWEAIELLADELQRSVIQRDLGKRVIVVVGEDGRWRRRTR